MNLKDTIVNYKQIVLINEVGYIGDSCIFFWPLVECLVTSFPDKPFTIYHKYSEIFTSPFPNLAFVDLKNKREMELDQKKNDFQIDDTLVISFISELSECSLFFKDKGYSLIYKGFVGFNFWTSNIEPIVLSSNFSYDIIASENKTYKYQFSLPASADTDLGGFPTLGKPFSNVYEYAEICNTAFLGLEVPIKMDKSFIKISNPENKRLNDLVIHPLKDENKPFVFFNFNVGNHKDKLLKKRGGALDVFEGILMDSDFFDGFNFIVTYPEMEMNLYEGLNNLILKLKKQNCVSILKKDSKKYWTYLQMNAPKIISYDTGFVHLAYVLNEKVLSIGGDSQFWHFTNQVFETLDYYTIKNELIKSKFNTSVENIVDYILLR